MVCSARILFFATTIAQVLTQKQLDCQCGQPSDALMSMRIVGGRKAVPHSFPWTVATVNSGFIDCGGQLITTKHILTAAHCLIGRDLKEMTVLLGLDNVQSRRGVEEIRIAKAVIHEHFASTKARDENDIGIITLERPVRFNEKIVPICLPQPGQDFSGRTATLVGWGRMGEVKARSNVLLQATLKILSYQSCLKTKLRPYLLPTMMCAYARGQDGCQGDSGGPLVVFEPEGKYVLAGIVSWGIGCGDPRYPGVYTNVSYYVDWIQRHTKDGQTCTNSTSSIDFEKKENSIDLITSTTVFFWKSVTTFIGWYSNF